MADLPAGPGLTGPEAADARGWALRTAVLAAVLLLALVVLAVLAVGWRAHRDRVAGRATAVATAEQVVTGLSSIGGQNAGPRLDELKAQATGPFRTQLDGFGAAWRAVLEQGRVDARGRVVGAGVERLTDTEASVLVAVDTTVANSVLPQPEVRHYRMAVALQRDGDRWLVSVVEPIR